MVNTIEKLFTVHSIPDYNTLVALLKEMHCCILHIKTSSGHIDDSEEIKIVAQGEDCFLAFVDFLFKKYKKKIDSLNSRLETAADV